MVGTCRLCGKTSEIIAGPDLFPDGTKYRKVTPTNWSTWCFAFGMDLLLGDRLCRAHFDSNINPLPHATPLDGTHWTSPSKRPRNHVEIEHDRKKGRPSKPPPTLSGSLKREQNLLDHITLLQERLEASEQKHKQEIALYQSSQPLPYSVQSQPEYIALHKRHQDLLTDYRLSASLALKPFDIARFRDDPAAIRNFTTLPDWDELLSVKGRLQRHIDAIHGSSRRHKNRRIDDVNLVAMLMMKGRKDFTYTDLGYLYRVSDSYAGRLVHRMMLSYLSVSSGPDSRLRLLMVLLLLADFTPSVAIPLPSPVL
eukprot:TRINITY_DN18031_c0_g1_i3.p1 TRINITY_DN18031_c0_g1~~TRINITY_DN18031_c0_g1_i3.p1  ORF type:complete len:311 (-),score=24.05 TRINITY_DN18031_c0_g1_i3:13-945(-)